MDNWKPDEQNATLGYARVGKIRPRHAWLWWIAGVVVTLPLLGVAVFAAAAGHGTYLPLILFFPVPSVLMNLPPLQIPDAQPVLMVLAMLQYPLYGILMYFAELKGRRGRVLALLALTHFTLVFVAWMLSL